MYGKFSEPLCGTARPNIQPQDVYTCADSDVILVVGNDGQFAKLCGVYTPRAGVNLLLPVVRHVVHEARDQRARH